MYVNNMSSILTQLKTGQREFITAHGTLHGVLEGHFPQIYTSTFRSFRIIFYNSLKVQVWAKPNFGNIFLFCKTQNLDWPRLSDFQLKAVSHGASDLYQIYRVVPT